MFSSIVIAGVGGQGTLLASKILSEAAQKRGLFVRTSETIGMAQRGGSVSSHLRIGSEDVSPVIPLRHADVLIGFELAEAARQLNRLKPDASAVVNVDCIVPINVALRQGEYLCDDYLSALKKNIGKGFYINAAPLAIEAGDARTLNIVLLGFSVGAGILPFNEQEIREAMECCIKPKLLEINKKAFLLGAEAARNQI
ncbi:MAG: indolepyruvate oxidoreductase subunit beta [Synergistaceae bacterium]|jgi:indolepyruvate ferredoxin oxidoreductase beta subunit|nr:indolepyruvate oxidoreductase subunit beta [Synergistaceae bacterium]